MKPIKPVYLAANPIEAAIVRNYLEAAGVRLRPDPGYSWGGGGELPLNELYPRLYLEDEGDRERARQLLRAYERGQGGADWACRSCGERSPGGFERCWNCQAEREEFRQP